MDLILFYIASAVAIAATIMVVTGLNATHALIYLIVSLLAVAVVLFVLGAPFAAALEVVVYAGAIMVLFLFVAMMLQVGEAVLPRERAWLRPRTWLGPAVLAFILFAEVVYVLADGQRPTSGAAVGPVDVGVALFGRYLLAVELAAFLLLAALVAAYHLGRSYRIADGGNSV